ncbi:cytochrome P450 [Streptomyces sp. NPDC093595]|uniref:cytochrome P450 n=1 Tax=Streptomyces sp. NPDC093595 TaxID=3366045 RepID=UPI003826BFC3
MSEAACRRYVVTEPPALDFDPFLLASLREWPIFRIQLPFGEGVAWLVTRYDDVVRVVSDPRFSRARAGVGSFPRTTKHNISRPGTLTMLDPPEHTRLRAVVNPLFSRQAMDRLRPVAQDLLDRLLEDLLTAGPPADLVRQVISPFTLHVSGELIGVPTADRERIREWSRRALMRSTDDAGAHNGRQASQAMSDYFRTLVSGERVHPGDSTVLGALLAAVNRGGIDEDELAETVTGLQINAWNILRNNFSNFLYVLLTHEELWAHLRSAPQLLPQAVEELLRWTPSRYGIGRPRLATDDVEIGGVTIRKDEYVCHSYMTANRDEDAYPDAGRIDFTRQGPPQLAFGHGPHYCPGAPLSRMEADILLGTLLRRLPRLRLAHPAHQVRWQPGTIFRGPEELTVTW